MTKKEHKIPHSVAIVLADDTKNWKTLLCALLFFIWESVIFYLYLKGELWLPFLILFHCLALALIVWFNYHSYRQKEDLRYPLLLLLATFGMGPWGIAGLLIFMLLHPIFRLAVTPFSQWFYDLFPEHENIFTNVFQRIRAGWDDYSQPSEVIPFHDFFTYGSLQQKQTVLDQIATHYRPEYTPILQAALNDPSNVIRIQAAAIESKIDHEFEVKLKELERERNPNDPTTVLRIAKHYDYYAFLNVFNPLREKESQQKAIDYYHEYLDKQPEDQQVWFSIGRLRTRMHDYPGVIRWFEQLKEKFKEFDVKIYPWYLEALYYQKEYEKLTHEAQHHLPALKKAHLPQEVLEYIEAWGNPSG